MTLKIEKKMTKFVDVNEVDTNHCTECRQKDITPKIIFEFKRFQNGYIQEN